jgi:hypothetical protein
VIAGIIHEKPTYQVGFSAFRTCYTPLLRKSVSAWCWPCVQDGMGSEMMASCRKQRVLVGCRYGLHVGDGVLMSGG